MAERISPTTRILSQIDFRIRLQVRVLPCSFILSLVLAMDHGEHATIMRLEKRLEFCCSDDLMVKGVELWVLGYHKQSIR